MSKLQDIPLEVLLDNLLPNLDLFDLLSLSCTNRFFATLGSQDVFWKRKLKDDFNFDGAGSARLSGWKFIYRNMRNPQVYLWGSASNGRIPDHPQRERILGGYPSPVPCEIRDALMVDIVAGGWCFHALDSKGQIHVWGQLADGFGSVHDGFRRSDVRAREPLRLDIGPDVFVTSLKCGRSFALAFDSNRTIWMFLSWGRPIKFTPSLLTDGGEGRIVQIECGWSLAAALNARGEVFVWWPHSGEVAAGVQARNDELDRQHTNANKGMADNDVINCFSWTMDNVQPFAVPPIPNDLPVLREGGKGRMDTKLVKIAAGDRFLIGLTDGGHVLAADFPNEGQMMEHVRWQFLHNFSDVNALRSLEAFEKVGLVCPSDLNITHISAHFTTFVAYSTGANSHVLMAKADAVDSSVQPTILPSLQNRGVVSVHLGDYHYGALTADGELFTWGQYSDGALGLGNPATIPYGQPGGYTDPNNAFGRPPDVRVPTKVSFCRQGSKKFCITAAAAGWHFGALVIDLESEHDEEQPEESLEEPADVQPFHPEHRGPVGIRVPIRVGLAGARGTRRVLGGRGRGD